MLEPRRPLDLNHRLFAAFFIAAVCLAAVGAWMGSTFYLRLATEALIFAGLALSVDLLLGYAGLLSLGQALYFGCGAYVSALILISTSSFWLAVCGAGCATAALAFLGGLIANRVRGVYFTLITLALAQVIAKVIYNTRELGASDGIIGVPIVDVGIGSWAISSASPAGLFIAVLVLLSGLYVLLAYLMNTPFGRLLLAIKANDSRVSFLGFSVWRVRMTAYVIAGSIAGLSGSLYPVLRGFVSPELLSFTVSGNAVVAVLLGGAGTLAGGIFGSMLLVTIKSALGSWTEHYLIVIGALFTLSILFLPNGLMGLLKVGAMRRARPGDAPSQPNAALLSGAKG